MQLQNSRMVIQERDRVIKELEERVAFLEAEASTAGSLLFHGDQRATRRERSRLRGAEEHGAVLWSRPGPIMQQWCLHLKSGDLSKLASNPLVLF